MRRTKTLKERFEAKFVKTDECWNYTAYKDSQGYGKIKIAGRLQLAHRTAWTLYVGEIPDGMCCLHHCDNPSCVRPDHLFLGTKADNSHDCVSKGRLCTPCLSGEKHGMAKLTVEQVAAIRLGRSEGATESTLAKEFDTVFQNISKIIRGYTWKNV